MNECPGSGSVVVLGVVALLLTSVWIFGRIRLPSGEIPLGGISEKLPRFPLLTLVAITWIATLGALTWVWGVNRLSENEYDLIIDWLSCEECERAMVDSIVSQIGCRAVPVLEEFLYGLPEEVEKNVGRRVTAQWNELQPTGIDSVDFVQHYVSNMSRMAQLRAAVGLEALEAWSIIQMAHFEAEYLGFSPEVTSTLQYLVTERPSDVPSPFGSSVSGSLLDTMAGQGVPGVSVSVTHCGYAPPARTPPQAGECWTPGIWGQRNSVSNAGGEFSITGLKPGVYQLDVGMVEGFVISPSPPLLIRLLAPEDHLELDFGFFRQDG